MADSGKCAVARGGRAWTAVKEVVPAAEYGRVAATAGKCDVAQPLCGSLQMDLKNTPVPGVVPAPYS